MSQILEPKNRPKLPKLLRLSDADPETRSIQVGVVVTLLFHAFLLWLAPMTFQGEMRDLFRHEKKVRPEDFSIELAPDEVKPPPAPKLGKFVETNPNAPEAEPDKTDNFARQNQKAAQEVPDKDSKLDMPKTEGKDIKNDTQIVTGSLQKPLDAQPAPALPEVKTPPQEVQLQTARQEKIPLPGFEKQEAKQDDGTGANLGAPNPKATDVPDKVDGSSEPQPTEGTGAVAVAASKPQPLPRPRLAQVRPGILQSRPIGVSNAGALGVNAHFSEFGDYLQELINIVSTEWDSIVEESRTNPPTSHVTVTFRLNSKGEVAEIMKVEQGEAGAQWTNACVSAITNRAPYRPWTKPMVAVLGEDQVITFTFNYW